MILLREFSLRFVSLPEYGAPVKDAIKLAQLFMMHQEYCNVFLPLPLPFSLETSP